MKTAEYICSLIGRIGILSRVSPDGLMCFGKRDWECALSLHADEVTGWHEDWEGLELIEKIVDRVALEFQLMVYVNDWLISGEETLANECGLTDGWLGSPKRTFISRKAMKVYESAYQQGVKEKEYHRQRIEEKKARPARIGAGH